VIEQSLADGGLRDAGVEVAAAETPDPSPPSDAAQVVDPIGNREVVTGVVFALVVAEHVSILNLSTPGK
jgi:hypothetical protein